MRKQLGLHVARYVPTYCMMAHLYYLDYSIRGGLATVTPCTKIYVHDYRARVFDT